MTDGNKILETIVRRTFNALFGWELVNLNSETANFPAADLGDRKRRLAIQVTNEASSQKVTTTTTKAQDHQLDHDFDKLIIFFLLPQKPGYPKNFIQPVSGLKIEVWDNADVVKQALEIEDLDAIKRALDVLSEEMHPLTIEAPNVASCGSSGNPFDHAEYGMSTDEELLLPSFFQVVYPELIQKAKITLKRGIKLRDKVEEIWKSHQQRGAPPADYYCDREGHVYTFSTFSSEPWKSLVGSGVIKPLPSFKSSDWSLSRHLAQQNEFTKLLQRNLEQLCSNVGTEFKLAWSKELKCYLFQAVPDMKIGKLKVTALSKLGTREVFKAIDNTLPGREGEIQHWKHQGFRHRFFTFGGLWFLNIEPFWAFTGDGKASQSRMHASSSRNMRKPERNRAVLGHVLFWAALLCKEPDILNPAPLFRLIRPAKLKASPSIRDDAWKVIEPDDEKKIISDDSKEDLWLL